MHTLSTGTQGWKSTVCVGGSSRSTARPLCCQPRPRPRVCMQVHASVNGDSAEGSYPTEAMEMQQPTIKYVPPSAPRNLGQLAPLSQKAFVDESYSSYRVTKESLSNRGMYMDGPSMALNGALLLLMLGLSATRIFSLDKRFANAVKQWREVREEERRIETGTVRRALESSWESTSPEDTPPSPPRS